MPVVVLLLTLLLPTLAAAQSPVPYDIVYIKSPRYGDTTRAKIPEVACPICVEPGTDLMLLFPTGTEDILVPGGAGAILDPQPDFRAEWVYYAKVHDATKLDKDFNYPHGVPVMGSDLFKIHVRTREIRQLTHGEWTPNPTSGQWSSDPLTAVPAGTNYTGYRPFSLAPAPVPGGRVLFASSRDGYLATKGLTFPNLQLYALDETCIDERGHFCVEKVGHLNLGSALHPTVLMDGRVMWSTSEAQGLRDSRVWGLWASAPDGRHWEPLMSAFRKAAAFHWQTQLSDGRIAVVDYYNVNNDGFGTLLVQAPGLPARPMADTRQTYFGDPTPAHPSNPLVRYGYDSRGPRDTKYPFSPLGLASLTPFAHGIDQASDLVDGVRVGKVTQPSAAPNNDVLLVWSPGPVNRLKRPVDLPVLDAGIYLLKGGQPVEHPSQLVLVKNDPAYNEQQPKALVPYQAIYGIPEPATLPWLPNDGTLHPALPPGTPYGLVGTSTHYKHNVQPWAPDLNWFTQGAAVPFENREIHTLRLVVTEPVTHMPRGPNAVLSARRAFLSPAEERLRILGEIPLRKYTPEGLPVLDVDGNPDTSVLAKIPADVPFTFQLLDAAGQALTISQTWHQLRPGEVRTDCGGCHAHAQIGTVFASTAAGQPGYPPVDLTQTVPWDVEYHRDVKGWLAEYAPAMAALTPVQLIEQRFGAAGEVTKPVLPFRSRLSPLLQTLAAAPETVRRQVAAWIDLGAPVTVHPTHGWHLRETRPTLTVRVHRQQVSCPTGCTPLGTTAVLQVGMASVYGDVAPEHLRVSLNGTDVTSHLVPEALNPGVYRLPLDGTGQGLVIAKVCPATGSCARARVERRAALQW